MDRVDIKTSVERRLRSLGYTIETSDDWTINFVADKVENYIKSDCNLSAVPKELFQAEVDMICGEFLSFKKNSGQLDIENFDFQAAEKSIQEGDVKVEFYVDGTMTNEQKFDTFVKSLVSGNKGLFASYRCIKW